MEKWSSWYTIKSNEKFEKKKKFKRWMGDIETMTLNLNLKFIKRKKEKKKRFKTLLTNKSSSSYWMSKRESILLHLFNKISKFNMLELYSTY